MVHPNAGTIVQKYSTCLDKAIAWLNKNGYTVYPRGVKIKAHRERNGNVVITTTDVLHFSAWPERGGNSNTKFHILASICETVSLKPLSCVRSTARVSYFHITDGVALVIESMHYDAEIPPQVQHPVCHAQGSNKPLSPSESFSFEIDSTAVCNRCQNVRIPTAFVNLPGLLVTLTANHLRKRDWSNFIKDCSAALKDIPCLASCDITDRICATEKLMALNWYGI